MRVGLLCQRIMISFILLLMVLFTGCNKHPIEHEQVIVVFRLDDYSALSNTDMELRVFDAFRKTEASITLGVIPYICTGNTHDPSPQDVIPLTSMKGDILKIGFNDGIFDVALHGYSHQTISAESLTELSGLGYNSQVDRLAKGKKLLEGMIDAPVGIFVPPWNRYDLNTLRALEELGFSTLSAGNFGEATEDCKLNFLPSSCSLSQLRDAIKVARTSSDTQPIIVVLFHTYDFKEIDEKRGNIDYQEFSALLNWLKSQKCVRILSISQATQAINDLTAKRFLLNKRQYSLSSLLPSLLYEKESLMLYREAHASQNTLLTVCSFYLTIIIIITVFSFMMGIIVFPRSALIMNIVTFGSIALMLIIVIYAFYDLQIGFKGMVLSAGIVGISIGSCLSRLYFKKKKRWVRTSMVKKY